MATKVYKKVHSDPKAAKKHMDKIKKRGGTVKSTVKDGKTVLEYTFKK
jgi:hypothetical protein